MNWSSPQRLESQDARVGGTGSISCRGITEDQAAEADARRGPLGFSRSESPLELRVIRDSPDDWDKIVQEARAEWGEADWTARDLRVPTS